MDPTDTDEVHAVGKSACELVFQKQGMVPLVLACAIAVDEFFPIEIPWGR